MSTVLEVGAHILCYYCFYLPLDSQFMLYYPVGGPLTFLQIIKGSGSVFDLTSHALHDLLSRRLLPLNVYLYVLLSSVRRWRFIYVALALLLSQLIPGFTASL